MGKRTNKPHTEAQRDRDLWPTPDAAMAPLLPHLKRGASFVEPCAGAGHMVDYFESAGHPCVLACDVHPLRADIWRLPATSVGAIRADLFITNPPWRWEWLEPIAFRLSDLLPTWLLLNADLAHNLQAQDLMRRCDLIVPIGRVKWIEGSKFSGGYENAAWYRFVYGHDAGPRLARRMPKLR